MGHFWGRVVLCFSVYCQQPSPLRQTTRFVGPASGGASRSEREARQYTDAIQLYLEANTIQPDAAFLYNVAFIYDRDLGDVRNAKIYYRKCIATPDADPFLVKRSRARLKALSTTPSSDPLFETAPVQLQERSQTHTPVERGTAMPYWMTLIGGMTLLAGGVTGLVARHDAEQFKAAKLLDEKLTFRESAERQAMVADGLMLGGGLTFLVGVTWILLDSNDGQSTSSIQLSPSGFLVRGAF